VISSLCTRVMVMYAGRVVESGPTRQVFDHPEHPYTWSLLRSVPRVDERRHERLISIKGMPPDLSRLPTGCTFHPRCLFKVERCMREEPPLVEVAADQEARCWVLMSNVSKESLAVRT
jgi:oligopeptide/dipeptide ABC transporter ATP-binding protein